MEEYFPWRSALGPVHFSSFNNDPSNTQRIPVNFAGGINLEENHLIWGALLEFRVVLRNWSYCLKRSYSLQINYKGKSG